MYCLLVYDIPDDRKRDKIADVCMDYGLDRIQYSAFLGKLHSTHQAELMVKLKKVLGRKAGNIQLFPLCDSDWAARQVIVQSAPGTQEAVARQGTSQGVSAQGVPAEGAVAEGVATKGEVAKEAEDAGRSE